jgi:hypothetical protein
MAPLQLAVPQQSPPEIAGVWLRFHELQLCERLDVVFVFGESALEAWCRIEDEGDYERLLQLVQPLRTGFDIEVYPTHLPEDKGDEQVAPPPSLSNNPELLNYLFATGTPEKRFDPYPDRALQAVTRDIMVKHRIVMFAEQVLGWSRKIRRYGGELPALVSFGFGRGASPGLKSRVTAICLKHAQEIERDASRLEDNLKQALPSESRRQRGDSEDSTDGGGTLSLLAAAQRVADAADAAARRVYRFIYPQLHTVAVTDLKEPPLLNGLRTLRRLTSEFQEAIRRQRP